MTYEQMLTANFAKPSYTRRFNPHTDVLLYEGELIPDAKRALDSLKNRVALRHYGDNHAARGWHIRTDSGWRPLGVRIPRSEYDTTKMIGYPFLIAILAQLDVSKHHPANSAVIDISRLKAQRESTTV